MAPIEGVMALRWIKRSTAGRLAIVAVTTVAMTLGVAGAATAGSRGDSQNVHRVANQSISVQLFNFFAYIGFDASPGAQARQEEVLSRLSAAGYRNVEPVDYTSFQGLGASQYRTLLDKYGLKASALHTSISMATTDEEWQAKLAIAKTIGSPYVGAGADPRTFTTAAEWIAFAEKIDHFGELARKQGLRYMVHSHDWEFAPVEGTTGYDILQEYTNPNNVVFELDLYWVTKAGVDPVSVIERYGDRIKLFHVKDMATDGSITTVGEGTIDFPRIFAAAGNAVRYYVIERDPPFTDPTYDPFGPSLAGLQYLQTVRF